MTSFIQSSRSHDEFAGQAIISASHGTENSPWNSLIILQRDVTWGCLCYHVKPNASFDKAQDERQTNRLFEPPPELPLRLRHLRRHHEQAKRLIGVLHEVALVVVLGRVEGRRLGALRDDRRTEVPG